MGEGGEGEGEGEGGRVGEEQAGKEMDTEMETDRV
jgi:hypothetical protein